MNFKTEGAGEHLHQTVRFRKATWQRLIQVWIHRRAINHGPMQWRWARHGRWRLPRRSEQGHKIGQIWSRQIGRSRRDSKPAAGARYTTSMASRSTTVHSVMATTWQTRTKTRTKPRASASREQVAALSSSRLQHQRRLHLLLRSHHHRRHPSSNQPARSTPNALPLQLFPVR